MDERDKTPNTKNKSNIDIETLKKIAQQILKDEEEDQKDAKKSK